jgi:NAD(P)-dependent dehydrogenase (short-subunit alcohol dehydrogenase family)
MTIAGKTGLVTGANRGIGQALVAEALSRGATRVYAGTRQPLAHPDPRVTPLTLDVTNTGHARIRRNLLPAHPSRRHHRIRRRHPAAGR